jgi:hypothetical protein
VASKDPVKHGTSLTSNDFLLVKENEWKGDPNCIICGKLENA